ncbi:MAG: carbamoyltransferase HypF [Candidatus Omnitrophica bacterium]|nr:carbamoyltransferase HypF [Candidatus Omnitrophota bacterium]
MSKSLKDIVTIIKSPLNFKDTILAFGAELKNTFCLAIQGRIYVSKDNGNLEEFANFIKFEKKLNCLLKTLKIKPKIIAYDLHPEYLSTKFALDFAKKNRIERTIAVQHHHAHIASCMLYNNIKDKVIGVAFDGTGFGLDGNIWGGEFLIADFNNFRRAAHLRYIPMPGGKQAILEPWRMSLSWLNSIFKDKVLKSNFGFSKKINKTKLRIIKQMLDNNINSPLTSSTGRLFDAVASLITKRQKVEFEAQAAIELEEMAFSAIDSGFSSYGFKIKENACLIIDPSLMFRQITRDLNKKVSCDKIAFKFHCTIAKIITEVCLVLRRKTRINKAVLSGGVFQNRIVSELAQEKLQLEKFKVFTHNKIPINDAGISIGQAIVANVRFSQRR